MQDKLSCKEIQSGGWDVAKIVEDRLLSAVSALHAAAVDPQAWANAFDAVTDLMGASGMLLGRMPHSGGQFELVGHRIDSDIVDRINGPLASRDANPVFNAIPRAPVLAPAITSAIIDEDTLLRSRVYDEALRPADVRYTIATVLACNAERSYALAFGRDARHADFSRDDVRTLSALSPHILAAVKAHHLLSSARGGSAALDALDRGVLLVDGQGRICFTNREADRILAQEDGLRLGVNGLEAARYDDNARLQSLLNLHSGASAAVEATGRAVAISRPSLRPAYTIVAAPFYDDRGVLPDFGAQASLILFLRDPALQILPQEDWLCQLYGLTKSEATIALDIHEGLTVAEVAERRKVSINTVKTHLKTIFAKMDVTRQSGLVRQIALAIGDLRLGAALNRRRD